MHEDAKDDIWKKQFSRVKSRDLKCENKTYKLKSSVHQVLTQLCDQNVLYTQKHIEPLKEVNSLYFDLIDQPEIVTNKHQSSFKVIDGISQCVNRLHIQMICRFIK